MAGCKYSNPTKRDVIREMKSAFRTLDAYIEIEGREDDIPDIFCQLLDYINKESKGD